MKTTTSYNRKNILSLSEKRNIVIIIAIHNSLNNKPHTKDKILELINSDLEEYGLLQVNDFRTVERGIATIEKTLKFELIKTGKPRTYVYKDKAVKIARKIFEATQMYYIATLYDILISLDGLAFKTLYEKLFEILNTQGFSKLQELRFYENGNATQNSIIQFESHFEFKINQNQLFLKLFEYILNKTVIEIVHKQFEVPEVSFSFSPFLLKQYNKRWFLYGFDHSKNRVTFVGLERLTGISELKDPFNETAYVDFFSEDYFEDIVGVTKMDNEILTRIKIKATRSQYNYIASKPIHESQKLIKSESSEDFKVFEIEVIPNYELKAMLMSFGNSIQILEPASFREEHIKNIQTNLDQYKK